MNDQVNKSGNQLSNIGKVLCGASLVILVSILLFSGLFNTSIIHLGFLGGLLILCSICLFPSLGGCFYLSGNITKEKQDFARLWRDTSGKLTGQVVYVYHSRERINRIKLLMGDGTYLFISYGDESTGHVPELHDQVNITINREKKAVKTELVESTSKSEEENSNSLE